MHPICTIHVTFTFFFCYKIKLRRAIKADCRLSQVTDEFQNEWICFVPLIINLLHWFITPETVSLGIWH